MVWTQSIKPKDAIHVATALHARALGLETFDDDLLKKSGVIGNPAFESLPLRRKRVYLMTNKREQFKTDDKEHLNLFIKKGREIGADEEQSRSDELIVRLAKKPPKPRRKH